MVINKTFLEWCKEYISAIESIKEIAQQAKMNMEVEEYSRLGLLLRANKAIKDEAEKQIISYMENPKDAKEFKEGMLLLEPYMK